MALGMKKYPAEMLLAMRTVFGERRYSALALFASLAVFAILIYTPIITTPGNSLELQLAIMAPPDIALLVFLSLLMGALLSMQVYSFRHADRRIAGEAGLGAGAAFSTFIAGIFSTASCAACLSALFSFIGVGGIFFLLQYRMEIALLGLAFVVFSLYLTARKINGHCPDCGDLAGRRRHRHRR